MNYGRGFSSAQPQAPVGCGAAQMWLFGKSVYDA